MRDLRHQPARQDDRVSDRVVADDLIIVRADPGGLVLVFPHFQKYGVFDDVSIDDRSPATFELHLLGARAPICERAAGRLPDEDEYAHLLVEIGGRPVRRP